jgi:hypothetical protein
MNHAIVARYAPRAAQSAQKAECTPSGIKSIAPVHPKVFEKDAYRSQASYPVINALRRL